MKRLKGVPAAFTHGVGGLCFGLSVVLGGAALAQTTGAVNPAPADTVVKEDVPPGGCMPIGMTVAGEMVFPIQCAEFIERERGKAVQQKSALANEAPSAKPSEAAVPEKPSEAAAPEKPSEVAIPEKTSEAAAPEKTSEPAAPKNRKPPDDAVETKATAKRLEHERRQQAANSAGCEHYRTYDRKSGTFRSYDGHRHSCP